ncbi:acyltransferase [Caulobacter sp. NIBR1757]|uniref:acyltransferase family protein n=1 Tax=Caulobacter sp. NIBR1757 TaxID=3016000 RepID=UPI0022F116A5|nr:acyltransferase [Caulobacter sp. NIBR1757]WGM41076.1 O-acetyltransferase OatA [Caulobacter sp. NIBR1757]
MNDAAHIKPLTGLRFFAAMWVVLYHYWPNLQVGAGSALVEPALIGKGYLGVELFFTLSGFILCHVYLESFGEGRFRYGAFLWNRLARVYPLHLATLLGVMALGVGATAAGFAIDANILSWESLPANLLLLQAWGAAPQAAFNHPSWSISAEWFAYLTFPLFAWAAWRLRHRAWLGAGLALGFMAVLYPVYTALTGESLTEATIHWGILRIVPCFALGCAMHGLWRAGAVKTLRAGAVGAAFMGAGALMVAVSGAPDLLAVAGFGGLILCLAGMAEHGSRFASGQTSVYLGEISYSVYMICVPWKLLFVNAATRLLNTTDDRLPWYIWLLFIASVIPLAAASYHLIEKPARARMKLLMDSWAKRRSVAPAM